MLDDLKIKYKSLLPYERLIAINVIIFTVVAIVNAIAYSATKKGIGFIGEYFALSDNLNSVLLKIWTIFTYGFLHFSFMHMLGNMIALYFTGQIFSRFFTNKQLYNFYFLGILSGAVCFLLAYNLFPAFINEDSILVGASAAVFSLLIGAATYAPNYEIQLLITQVRVKLWIIAGLYVIAFISLIPGNNSGGEFAHLGGALLGYIYASQLKQGKDIGKGFEKIMDSIASWFKPKPAKMKTVHRSQKRTNDKTIFQKQRIKQEKIDAILDKISKSGYESLSKEEKDFLFQAGKE
ncbi:rhomboid family intramembrane serine protease [Pseudofulvibacter geojedonensis]|uniref:Rhomboid family intramembrane serine protease n=1 Tax=Pseudofulvibacter geojedonensis TaxID=1123758 RepID=A0ABW3I2G6_9FLAO